MTRYRWELRPVVVPLNQVNVWEHTPLNPYGSEYPRFIRPPRDECRTEWVRVKIEEKT